MQNFAKKIIPYLFILIALFVFFGFAEKVDAQPQVACTSKDASGTPLPAGCVTLGTCKVEANSSWYTDLSFNPFSKPKASVDLTRMTETDCKLIPLYIRWDENTLKESQEAIAANASTQTPFEDSLNEGCGKFPNWTLDGCLLKFIYYTYFQLPTFVLWLSAQVFNALISLVIQSSMYTANFIATAWEVVRDISNIFFILILLYIAIKIILDLAGHEAKKMIAQVIIMALLINFSMFFTKVVIDTSNVLAQIFYNKLETKTKDSGGAVRPYTGATSENERDISGAIYQKFDATKLLSPEFLDKIRTTEINGKPHKETKLPFALTLGIIVIAGSIMLWAAFTFFVAGIFFLGRLVELWVLMIFSPFAFMSFALPLLRTVPFVGWDEWLKKLVATSFMAPIFMFFMYLIFKLLEANIFNSFTRGEGAIVNLLNIIIPAMILMALLKQATNFAKKGGGMFGELAMTGAKLVGGIALGAATGGASLALTNTLGAKAQSIANDDNLRAQASGDKAHFAKLGITDVNQQKKMQAAAQKKLATANKYANKSFDIRDTGIGKFAAKQSGMDFNKGTGVLGVGTDKLKGGRMEQTKHKIEEEEKKNKTYELSGDAAVRQNNRAAKYEEDKKQAKLDAENAGQKFDEDTFKEEYEKGNLVGYGRDDRKVEDGSVENTAQINKDRRKAYADSLVEKAKKEADKNIVKTFGSEWAEEMKKMYTTAGGVAQTAALGAATGGVGLIAGPLALSLARAIKTTVAKKVMGDVRSTNAEVIAGVRKGPDEYKELIKKMKKDLEGGSHGGGAAPTHGPTTPAAAPSAASATPPPASGGSHPHP